MSVLNDILVKWVPESSGRVTTIQVRSRLVGATEWTMQSLGADASIGELLFTANAANTDIEVQTRFRMASGVYSPWTDNTTHLDGIAVDYSDLQNKPTKLADINGNEGGKLGGIESGATVGSKLGSNAKDSSGNILTDQTVITAIGKSGDSDKLAGTPGATIIASIASVQASADDIRNNVIPGVNTTLNNKINTTQADLNSAKVSLATVRDVTVPGINTDLTNAINQARADASTANSSTNARIDSIEAVSGNGATTAYVEARVSQEAGVRASGDSSLGYRIDQTQSSVSSNTSRIITEEFTRSTQDGALSTRIENARSEASGNLAGVQNQVTTLSNAQGATAQRVSVIEATAGNTGSTLNSNPSFSIWPDGSSLPVNWGYWETTSGFSRANSQFTPGSYMVAMSSAAGVQQGLYQTVYMTPGWWVMEAQIWFAAGSISGAGLYCGGTNDNINFATDKDSNGVVGGITSYGVRRYSKLVQSGYAGPVNFHPMNSWDGFG